MSRSGEPVDLRDRATVRGLRTADALRKLAETLEEQPDAIYRGKRPK